MSQTKVISNIALFLGTSLFLAVSALMNTAASAESPSVPPSTAPAAPSAPSKPPTAAATLPSISEVEVTDIFRLGSEKEADRNSAGVGDIVILRVRDLQSLSNRAKCLDKDGRKVQDCKEQEISLYLDGRRMKGIPAESLSPAPEEGRLQFHLVRSTDNDEAWADLLGSAPLDYRFFKRPTEISVGLESGYPVPVDTKDGKFNLIRIREVRFWLGSIGIVLLAFAILWLANKTEILRDSGPAPGTDEQGRKLLRPYSLGRCQMAFWFFWVIASFLYIWLITGAYDMITASVLGLIGIGAGTALGSAAIDVNKREDTGRQIRNLQAEKPVLESDINDLAGKIEVARNAVPQPATLAELQQTKATKEARLNVVNGQLPDLVTQNSAKASAGILDDILTDANGLSFHRFQMALWTIVLGIIFVVSVWTRLSMPEFSATLLALLGISNGTYLGFKIPEKQA